MQLRTGAPAQEKLLVLSLHEAQLCASLVLSTMSWDHCDMLSKSIVKGERSTSALLLQHGLLLHCRLWGQTSGVWLCWPELVCWVPPKTFNKLIDYLMKGCHTAAWVACRWQERSQGFDGQGCSPCSSRVPWQRPGNPQVYLSPHSTHHSSDNDKHNTPVRQCIWKYCSSTICLWGTSASLSVST